MWSSSPFEPACPAGDPALGRLGARIVYVPCNPTTLAGNLSS
jgi:hypothetical protein